MKNPLVVDWPDGDRYVLTRFPTSRAVVPSKMQRERVLAARITLEAKAIIGLTKVFEEIEEREELEQAIRATFCVPPRIMAGDLPWVESGHRHEEWCCFYTNAGGCNCTEVVETRGRT